MLKIKTRILGLRLPIEHWIWGEIDKQKVAREALDQHKEISAQYKKLTSELMALREAIENRGVFKGEEKIASQSQEEKAEINKTGEIDAKEFLKTIKNAFEF